MLSKPIRRLNLLTATLETQPEARILQPDLIGLQIILPGVQP